MDYIALNFVLLLEQVNCVNVYRIMVFDSFSTQKGRRFSCKSS